jgi:AraC-like DNA-binding protein
MSRLALARIKAAGIAPEPLLQKSGLTRHQLETESAPVKVRDQIRFLNAAAESLQDDLLGFHLALGQDLREIGLLYYVLASSEVLIDALQRAARYSSIVNEGIAQHCVDGAAVGMSFHYVGVSRHTDRHQIEFWMTALVQACRRLTGLRLMPSRVRFSHRRPRTEEMIEFFGDSIEFGAPVDDLVFPSTIRQSPVVSADPYLNKLLIHYCEEALAYRPTNRGSFQASVENAIAPLLPHGKARASEIARRLGVSQRTLARRLSQEGQSFSNVLDGLRSDLANRYLAEGDLPISQIAWLLGYQEAGAFSHAFKRWTGETPRVARRKAT